MWLQFILRGTCMSVMNVWQCFKSLSNHITLQWTTRIKLLVALEAKSIGFVFSNQISWQFIQKFYSVKWWTNCLSSDLLKIMMFCMKFILHRCPSISTHHHWDPVAGSPDQRSPAWLWYWQPVSRPGQALEEGETKPPPAPSSETPQTLSLQTQKGRERHIQHWENEHDDTCWDKRWQDLPNLLEHRCKYIWTKKKKITVLCS